MKSTQNILNFEHSLWIWWSWNLCRIF